MEIKKWKKANFLSQYKNNNNNNNKKEKNENMKIITFNKSLDYDYLKVFSLNWLLRRGQEKTTAATITKHHMLIMNDKIANVITKSFE